MKIYSKQLFYPMKFYSNKYLGTTFRNVVFDVWFCAVECFDDIKVFYVV